MKVLLFANDLMPFADLPTSGGGLRCFQLMKGLECCGIEVVASMPGFTFLAKKYHNKLSAELQEHLWDFETQDAILRKVKPDAVLYASNWDHYSLIRKPDIPLIFDLHGSRLVETAMWGIPESGERKVEVLSKADCLITAGQRQRLYFYGWLVQSGRIPDSEHFIKYIPVSCSPNLPSPSPHKFTSCNSEGIMSVYRYPNNGPVFVSGGGWFPWQDQSNALYSICDVIQERGGEIDIYGTPHQSKASSPEEQVIHGIYKNIQELSLKCEHIRAHDYVSRDDLIKRYSKSHIALELMRYNLERELAFTTRTVEYLWCGLPVIYNNYAELSEHIADYDAGWLVCPDDRAGLSHIIDSIYQSPKLVLQKSSNAQALVRDRFTWDKTIAPLVEYLKCPKNYTQSQAVLGAVHSRPSFLNPQGKQIDTCIDSRDFVSCQISGSKKGSLVFFQRFVVPAENVTGVEISYRFSSEQSKKKIKKIVCKLWKASSILPLVVKSFDLANTIGYEQSRISPTWPFWCHPIGGDIMDLSIEIHLREKFVAEDALIFSSLKNSDFPSVDCADDSSRYPSSLEIRNFRSNKKGECFSKTHFARRSEAKSLAITYVPAEFSKMYQMRMLAKRGILMIKQGEWKRAIHAIKRRAVAMYRKLLHSA